MQTPPHAGSQSHHSGSQAQVHTMPFGTEVLAGGGVRFRLFAPDAESVKLELNRPGEPRQMTLREPGWHEAVVPEAGAGSLYRFVLPDGLRVPDPASRFQPQDVYSPSEVIDPAAFCWTDTGWAGRPWNETVLYELHIGAFTPQGTFRAAIGKLDYIRHLGITAVELMALADFPGSRNWGYDGVLLYAPDSAYGRPDDLKALVDAAHARGIMVIVDVVYNHLGAEANWIPRYWPSFPSPDHNTPWGQPPNFDRAGSQEVREFIIHNAIYWVNEFHADGLRLDATHGMTDTSSRHILDELADRVHAAAGSRRIHLIIEDEHNASRRMRRDSSGRPLQFSAQWNHEMAHLRELYEVPPCNNSGESDRVTSIVARMTTFGFGGITLESQESGELDPRASPTAYISFLQTHDLAGNNLDGGRFHFKAPVEVVRALSALYLLVPQIPMLFMGDEWAASAPFTFFADYHGEFAEKVTQGRREFVRNNLHLDEEALKRMPDPMAIDTFARAHLNWAEPEQPVHAAWLDWHRRVLAVRREKIAPLLRAVCDPCGRYRILRPGVFVAEWELDRGVQLKLEANLCAEPNRGFAAAVERLVWLEGEETSPGEFGPWTVRFSGGGAQRSSPDAR